MKKSNISRRDFMRDLGAGVLSVAIAPSWAVERYPMSKYAKSAAGGEQTVTNLPPLFDCNKYIGPGFPQRPDFPRAADLLVHMNRLGIDRAVAWHTSARDLHPMAGNEQLIMEIDAACAHDRIIPSFIIAPSMIDDPGVMDHFLDLVKTHHIHCFHFFPKKFGWSLQDISPVIKSVLPFKPVLFLDSFENISKENGVLNFSEQFPQVSIIFTNAMWPHYKRLYELMEARPNIFVDISLLHTYRTIEYIIQRFGVERLIFGAGYKSNNGASIASLVHSEISPEHEQLIAHGNLERLLEIESPLSGSRPVEGDRLWHRLLRRERLGPEIIDAHTHHSHGTMNWDDHDRLDFDGYVNHALRSMDSMGVRTMIVAEYELYPPDLTGGMTFFEKHLGSHGDRFRGYFCALAFKAEYSEKMIPRLDEYFSRPYYVGFKMHNDHWSIPVTDPCFVPMWEYANAHRLPILLHTWEGNYNAPKMLKDIAPRYPDATIILGHSSSGDRPDAEKLAQENPNVYLEWCGSFCNPADWCETLERLGNRRLVYGSDGVTWENQWGHSPAWEMGRLLSLNVPDETLLPILGDNMRGILSWRR
ncbi:MAG: amidohydrolase family protein [Bacteroidales bacterium]|nr:amidohydrolase family protein [Bacteroidales bacterium]